MTYIGKILILLLTLMIFPSLFPLHADDQITPNPNNATINVTEDDWNNINFRNNGTLNITDSGYLENNEGAVLTNAGTLNNDGSFMNCGTFTSSGTINNNGTLGNCIIMINTGTIKNNSGGWIFNSDTGTVFTNAVGATLLNDAGAQLTNQDGAILINNGTLTNNGWLGNDAGAILTNNGTLTNNNTLVNFAALNNNGTMTNGVGAMLINAGTFTNSAGSAFTNNGTFDNWSGATFVNNGTFNNGGTFTNKGIVTGTGTIVGNFSNDGTIAPGNSIGTMTVTGNYTHNAGAVYLLEIDATGRSDKLVVTGTAALNGGKVSVWAASGNYPNTMSTTYTILTAGSVTGTFASVSGNFAFMSVSLGYDPTHVYLILARNSTSFVDVALTPNQIAVASALDRIGTGSTGDMATVMDNLLDLTAAGARSAYDQMSGLTHVSLTEALFFSLNRYIGALSDRMGGFSMGRGEPLADAGNMLFALNGNTGSDAGNALLAAIQGIKETGGKEDSRNVSPWGLWARGYGNIGNRRGDDITAKYDHRGGGLIIGFDRKVSERMLLGTAAGYSYTKVNMNDLSDDGKVASYQGSLYGAYNIGPWYANGLVAYGYNRYDTARNIVFGSIARTAHAAYGGHSLSGYAEAGYSFLINTVNIIPLVSMQAGSAWRNAFTETDAGALNLDAESNRESSLIGSLGLKMKKEFRMQKGFVTPEIRVRWLHEFADGEYTVNASFAGNTVSAFNVRGERAQRDSAAIGLGLSWGIGKNFGLALAYDAVISGDRTDHGATAGIRYRW